MKHLTRMFAAVFVLGLSFSVYGQTNNTNNSLDEFNVQTVTPEEIKSIEAQAPDLSPAALQTAVKSYDKARAQGLDPQQILTIVDFSKPSTDPRFFVIDFKQDKVLFDTLVAHGKNSGADMTTSFSNAPQSDESSLGLYVTQQPYYGHDGYALRLQGVTPGYNTNAEARDVVVHGAPYVSPQFAAEHGRLGRSWGCFALDENVVKPVINTIQGGTLIFAYAPVPSFVDSSALNNV